MKIFLLLLTTLFHSILTSTVTKRRVDLKELYHVYSLHPIPPKRIEHDFRKYFEQNKEKCFYEFYEYLNNKDITIVNYALGVIRGANINKEKYRFYSKNILFIYKIIAKNITMLLEGYKVDIYSINISIKLFTKLLACYRINHDIKYSFYQRMSRKIRNFKRYLAKKSSAEVMSRKPIERIHSL